MCGRIYLPKGNLRSSRSALPWRRVRFVSGTGLILRDSLLAQVDVIHERCDEEGAPTMTTLRPHSKKRGLFVRLRGLVGQVHLNRALLTSLYLKQMTLREEAHWSFTSDQTLAAFSGQSYDVWGGTRLVT